MHINWPSSVSGQTGLPRNKPLQCCTVGGGVEGILGLEDFKRHAGLGAGCQGESGYGTVRPDRAGRYNLREKGRTLPVLQA